MKQTKGFLKVLALTLLIANVSHAINVKDSTYTELQMRAAQTVDVLSDTRYNSAQRESFIDYNKFQLSRAIQQCQSLGGSGDCSDVVEQTVQDVNATDVPPTVKDRTNQLLFDSYLDASGEQLGGVERSKKSPSFDKVYGGVER